MSNCLFFAAGQFIRHGGHFLWRKSHYGWWWHFIWSPDLKTFYEYLPIRCRASVRWAKWTKTPPPLFRGYVRVFRAD
jgi:hypothetical protein